MIDIIEKDRESIGSINKYVGCMSHNEIEKQFLNTRKKENRKKIRQKNKIDDYIDNNTSKNEYGFDWVEKLTKDDFYGDIDDEDVINGDCTDEEIKKYKIKVRELVSENSESIKAKGKGRLEIISTEKEGSLFNCIPEKINYEEIIISNSPFDHIIGKYPTIENDIYGKKSIEYDSIRKMISYLKPLLYTEPNGEENGYNNINEIFNANTSNSTFNYDDSEEDIYTLSPPKNLREISDNICSIMDIEGNDNIISTNYSNQNLLTDSLVKYSHSPDLTQWKNDLSQKGFIFFHEDISRKNSTSVCFFYVLPSFFVALAFNIPSNDGNKRSLKSFCFVNAVDISTKKNDSNLS